LLLYFYGRIAKTGIGFSAGLIFGNTNEYVFNGDKTISVLEWQEETLPAVNFDGKLYIGRFFLDATLLFALPLNSVNGKVEDYDYLLDGSSAVSNYSMHNLYTDKHNNLSLKVGYKFIYKEFMLEPCAAFSFYTRKWSAVGGYLQYPESDDEAWNENIPKENVLGTVLMYEQSIWFPSVGFTIGYTINGRFMVSLNAFIYPYLWAQATDSHFIRLKQFYDTLKGGLGYGFELNGLYYLNKTNKDIAITISAGYEKFNLIKGKTSSSVIGRGSGVATISNYQSGTDGSMFTVKMGIVFFVKPLFSKKH
jgi:outer membrane protease